MAGRKQKPYQTSWGEIIPGLAHDTSGRWRVTSTGFRFTEADERRAIQRFKELQPAQRLQIDVEAKPDTTSYAGKHIGPTMNALLTFSASLAPSVDAEAVPVVKFGGGKPTTLGYDIDPSIVWPWLRELLISDPGYVGKMVGIPELAGLARFEIPKSPVTLAAIWEHYETTNKSKSKSEAKRHWNRMVNQTQARTLQDLTKGRLHKFRESIESDTALQSGGTKEHLYGKVKAVIAHAKKSHDIDGAQVRRALDNCAVLFSDAEVPEYRPVPIQRDHLHTLLEAAGTGPWRAWILMGLNCAMYIEELCDLKWEHIDLEAGTLSMRRKKTKVARAAVLWPETVAALKSLRRGPVYVFTSPQGTRFQSAQSRCNEFAKLRDKCESVPKSVSFAQLKDGATTHAARGTVQDGRLANILAGHKCGMEDAYILRNPEIVAPACAAVYSHYGPFAEVSMR